MPRQPLWIFFLVLLVLSCLSASAFVVQRCDERQQTVSSRTLQLALAASSKDEEVYAERKQQEEEDGNEFSRCLSMERIMKTSGGKNRVNRAYNMHVDATNDECRALAKRFDLKQLAQLSADLSLRRPNDKSGSGGSASYYYTNGLTAVLVEGTISAHVTQTCVRTNEDFDVTMEIPVACLVKPTSSSSSTQLEEELSSKQQQQKQSSSSSSKPTRRKNNDPFVGTGGIDMADLQRLLESQIVSENSSSFFDDESIEDESIYSAVNGRFDAGELVAQSFWLNLDPYPKKPGTSPIRTSISG